MLDHDKFQNIMEREDLTEVDLLLLDDHLAYIGQIHKDYEGTMPLDVHETLMSDVRAIVDRLQIEYKKLSERRKRLDD